MPDLIDLGDEQFDFEPPEPERLQFWLWEFQNPWDLEKPSTTTYRNILLWVDGSWQTPGLSGQQNSIEIASMAGAKPIREISIQD